MEESPLAANSGLEAVHQPQPSIDPPAAIQQQLTVPTLQVALKDLNPIPSVFAGADPIVDPQPQISNRSKAVEEGIAADNLASRNEAAIETIADSSKAGETTIQYVFSYPCKVRNLTNLKFYSAKAVYHHILPLHMSYIRKKTFLIHLGPTCVLNPSLITYHLTLSSAQRSYRQMLTFVLTRTVFG